MRHSLDLFLILFVFVCSSKEVIKSLPQPFFVSSRTCHFIFNFLLYVRIIEELVQIDEVVVKRTGFEEVR